MSDYTIYVLEGNIGVVYKDGVEVFRSRPCRLSVQANRLANEWLERELGITYEDGITLEVQSVSIDPDTLFGKD